MTPEQARQRADRIIADLAAGRDPEGAHGDEDAFIEDVLRDILESKPDPFVRMMVEQAVRVADAPGERWYA